MVGPAVPGHPEAPNMPPVPVVPAVPIPLPVAVSPVISPLQPKWLTATVMPDKAATMERFRYPAGV
jgi:hypothetical protein